MPVLGLTDLPMPPWCQKWTCVCQHGAHVHVSVKTGWGLHLWRLCARSELMVGIASITYIAAAYADVCDADKHIMGICQFRYLFVFEFCVFGTVEDYRRILHFFD